MPDRTGVSHLIKRDAPLAELRALVVPTAPNYFAYNFIKIRRTLRLSAAMAAGVTDRAVERGRPSSPLGRLRTAEGGKSGSVKPLNIFMAILGVAFMVAAFKTRGFTHRSWREGDPIAPITQIGRVIIFLVGVSVVLAALGIISK